ncbi:amidase signature domain-containing protein [Cokeromyces recurvatus]|uniref:amidase signature domain-containing protein n=1 Tax=Cokeromyces recurvatus TaxID=90255 RepID=UPI0022201016|nr:amidase signature domain-containing protein [Cokeromyces recurvatus]KAI7905528.1 amidase signature domain-containing protein [Cokeromyces recurvatus]
MSKVNTFDKNIQEEEFKAPEIYGLPLLLAANAVEYIPFIKQKVASDALLYKLRDRMDIVEHPTTLAIPLEYINSPKDAQVHTKEIPKLDPNHKSTSPFLSFWDYHEAYTQFKTTPTKVAKNLMNQLEKSRSMNWVRFYTQDILEQAKASTERYKQHAPLSQIDGVFITIKEEINIKDLETKLGTSFISDHQPATDDATLVTKLRNAGAIIVGSTVMNELGWDTFTVNPNTGMPKNPYGLTHSCGGSSGGCGGCVAGGLFPISIGADGGGSIRIPSSFCGLYGLKTTYARVSAYGSAPVDPSLGSYGPLAATADDMTLAYSIIAGPDPKDPYSLLQPPVSLKDYDNYHDLSDLTIAVYPDWAKNLTEPVILEKLNIFKHYLEILGAHIKEIEIPDLDIASPAHSITICSEMHNFISRYESKQRKLLAHTRIMTGAAKALDSRDFIRAQQVRTRMMNHMRHIFEEQKVDLILCPTTALIAPEIPEKAHTYGMTHVKLTIRSMAFCTLANLTGLPAVNVPAGFHEGMPIGLQFMAKWWNEALLCRIAKACEHIPNIERKVPAANQWFGDKLLS